MAKALIIKAETERQAVQYIGDLLSVFPDDHVFSDHELSIFGVLKINGSVEDVTARLSQLTPTEATAFKWSSDDKYHFDTEDIPNDVSVLEIIDVFQVDNRWYKKTTGFKFPINIGELTAEEKQLLETIDITHTAVDSFIRKVVKDLTTQIGNDIEIKELRNDTP